MEAAAAVAAFRPAHILAPPNSATIRSKSTRLPAVATRTSTSLASSLLSHYYHAHNLASIRSFPTRCYPESHLSRSTDEPSLPASGSVHRPSADPKAPTTSAAHAPHPPGLVFSVGPDPSWDAHTVGSPVVKRYVGDDKEQWLMWYHGSSGGDAGDSIGLAVSNNGVHWERGPGPVAATDGAGQVMHRSNDWWAFDTHSVRPSEVLIMSSAKLRAPAAVYWMYYTGSTTERIEIPGDGVLFRSLPGLAISQDGRHWARIEGEHHSGALFDAGPAGEWDSPYIAAPKVVYHGGGDLRMYYHSFDTDCGSYAIGIARSRDGIRWVKLGEVLGGGPAGSFDEAGARNAHVVRSQREGGGYLMAYEGVAADGRTSVGLAVSSDGLKEWRRCGEEAVLKRSMAEDGWDNGGVGAPCLVQMDGGGEWRLYYRGFGNGGSSGIGLAVSQDPKRIGFERWIGFHLL